MTTTTGTIPKRRLDREGMQMALDAARALLLYDAPVARTALAYGTTTDVLCELLDDLSNDLAVVIERQRQ